MEPTNILGGGISSLGREVQDVGVGLFKRGQTPQETLLRVLAGGATTAAGMTMRTAGLATRAAGRVAGPLLDTGVGIVSNAPGVLSSVENVAGRRVSRAGNKLYEKGLRGLTKSWDRPYGKRITLGASMGIGLVAGGVGAFIEHAMQQDSTNVARGASEGSAYESGAGGFGASVKQKMPYASGAQVMGMHRSR